LITRSGFPRHRGHHVVELADIAAQHPHLGQLAEIGGLRLMSMTTESSPASPKSGISRRPINPVAADDQRRHVRFSPFCGRGGRAAKA